MSETKILCWKKKQKSQNEKKMKLTSRKYQINIQIFAQLKNI